MTTLLQINTSLFSDVEFVYAEGLNIDADAREQGLQAARQHSTRLAHSPAYA